MRGGVDAISALIGITSQCGSLGKEVTSGVVLLIVCFVFYFSFLYSQRALA